MSGPVRAIHSLAAPPRPPAPATAGPPPRRRATASSPPRYSSGPPPTPPSFIARRAAPRSSPSSWPPRPGAAAAFSLGIPGPKELLREQKKKSASYLLAPIAASRDTLLKAHALLASSDASAEDAEEVRGRIGAAGRDCVARQRNSIVAFQSRTGVEVCTFSLILKNAASLLANKDPLKVEADARLGELIQSFSDLGTVVESSNFELPDDREKMKDVLASAISALDKFEQSVKDCLGV